MKLLEYIVKNVPRENINNKANFFIQEFDGRLILLVKKPVLNDFYFEYDLSFGNYLEWFNFPMSDDASTTIITREELMRAYNLVEQGYTLWFGGGCPVGYKDVVEIVWRDRGYTPMQGVSNDYGWIHFGAIDDIIAYKLVEKSVAKEKISLPTYYCEDNLQNTTLGVWTSQSGDLCVNITSLGVNNEIVMSPITALQFANNLTTLALKLMEKEND